MFIKEKIDLKDPHPVIIYSNECTYENRNYRLANSLLDLAIIKNIKRGDTQMVCGLMHFSIEKKN